MPTEPSLGKNISDLQKQESPRVGHHAKSYKHHMHDVAMIMMTSMGNKKGQGYGHCRAISKSSG